MRIDPTKSIYAILLVCVVLFLTLTFSSILFGQPEKITRSFDPDGMACGEDFGLKDYPYIYFSNPTPNTLQQTVCVKECPSANGQKQLPKQLDCIPNSIVKECKEKISILDSKSQFLIYDSFHYMGNICMPRNLAFYESIKQIATPYQSVSETHNLYVSRWFSLIFIVLSLLSCYILMKYLKDDTKFMVWMMIFGLFILLVCLGIYFAIQTREAYNYSAETTSISSFQVDKDYILKMTNVPNPTAQLFLTLLFVSLTFYGGYFLYNNMNRIDDLADLFEQVEIFMNSHQYLVEFAYKPLIFAFTTLLLITLFTLLYLRSCFTLDFEQIGPFQKVTGSLLYYCQPIILFVFYWIMQILFGLQNFVYSAALVHWMVSYSPNQQQQQEQKQQKEQQQEQKQQQKQQQQQQQQQQSSYDHENSYLVVSRYVINDSIYFLPKITHASLWLMTSPIKFISDAIRDWVLSQKNEKFKTFLGKYLCCPFFYIYENLRQIEEVVFVELAITRKNNVYIGACFTFIERYLELDNEEAGTIETFEKLRNTVDSFILITKIFIALICAVTCKFLLMIYSWSFSISFYSTDLPILFSAIIGYYIASIYFSIYSVVVEGMGYVYLRTRHIAKENEKKEKEKKEIKKEDKKEDKTFQILTERFQGLDEVMQNLAKPPSDENDKKNNDENDKKNNDEQY